MDGCNNSKRSNSKSRSVTNQCSNCYSRWVWVVLFLYLLFQWLVQRISRRLLKHVVVPFILKLLLPNTISIWWNSSRDKWERSMCITFVLYGDYKRIKTRYSINYLTYLNVFYSLFFPLTLSRAYQPPWPYPFYSFLNNSSAIFWENLRLRESLWHQT